LLGDFELSATTELTRARLALTHAATKPVKAYEVEATLSDFAEAGFKILPSDRTTKLTRRLCRKSVRAHPARLLVLWRMLHRMARPKFLPNVKDEPRPSPARLVQHHDLISAASFRSIVR
jgi:hypothetical protein